MKALGALLWTAACHAAFQLAAFGLSLLSGALDLLSLGALQALVYVGASCAMLRLLEPGVPLRRGLGLRATHAGLGVVGVALGLCLKLPAESLSQTSERWFPVPEAERLSRASLYRAETPRDVFALLFVLCVAAPLVEELFFRGAAFRRLVKDGPGLAALVSGATFVAVHPDLRHWPALIVVAAVLSYLRWAGGSLLPCVALHAAFNGAGVLALVTGAASATRPLPVSLLPLLASVGVAALSLWLAARLCSGPVALRARAEDLA